MIVLGDYAAIHEINGDGLRASFSNGPVVLNLEGAVAEQNAEELLKKSIVFNTPDVIPFLKSLNVKVVTLANNHIFDVGASIRRCRAMLSDAGIDAVGAGENIEQACQPAVVHERSGVEYVIVPFCWNVTGGRYAALGKSGVSPLTKDNVERCIRKTKLRHPGAKIILIMHWGIELEKYPEPMHVQLAHYALDCGANMIIGHHPHCIQPIEVYKGKYIFYSIGNFYIEEDVYFDGRLRYPKLAREALAVEIRAEHISVLKLINDGRNVSVSKRINIEDAIREYGFPAREETYREWFKKHREKTKLIPIWHDMESSASNCLKDTFSVFRNAAVQVLLALHLKKGRKRD